jgi:hypothetical protein
MIKRFLPSLGTGIFVYLFVLLSSAHSAEVLSAEAGSSEQEKLDVHLSVYVLGSLPIHTSNLMVEGNEIPQTSIGGGIGAGYKAGIFPHFMKRIVGIEGESFGFGANVAAPRTVTGSGIRAHADAYFIVVTTMANLLVRYPGQTFQPYIGVGAGFSSGYLLGSDIQYGSNKVTGNATSMTFAYQFLGGLRGYVTQKVFAFVEYKYFVTKYDWGSKGPGPGVTLDLHAQLLSAGIGLSF